jgi:hypothetical protein
MDSSFDDDDLSIALSTETLAGREIIPEGFDNAPNSRDSIPIELISVERFLKVDQRYRRSGSTVSSIARSIMGCMTNIGAASTVTNLRPTKEAYQTSPGTPRPVLYGLCRALKVRD